MAKLNVFDDMGIYWAEIADQNQTQRQIGFLKSQLKPHGGAVLDLACGTGRHTIALSKAGYDMVGLDVSARLLKIAKKRYRRVHVVRGDIRFLPFRAEAFDAAISMDTSLGYLPSEQQDRAALAEAHRVLRQGSVLVVDVFNREQIVSKYSGVAPSLKRWDYPNFLLLQTRTVSAEGNELCDDWTVHDKASGKQRFFKHRVRLYDIGQLTGMLAQARLAVDQNFGDYEAQPFDRSAKRLILTAHAR